MILTRSTRLSQPADAAGVDSRFGGRNDWLIAPGSPGSLPISGVVPTIPDQYGRSHYFDGASLQVLGNDANVNATGGQFTLLAYAKFDNTTSDHGVVGNRATTGANAYAQIVHRAAGLQRRIIFAYRGTSASAEVGILSAAQSIPLGSTQLVALVVNGTSVRCYVGAELVGSGVSTAPVPSGHLPYLRAGNYYDNTTTRRFIGGIYYAGLLPVALSGEDIGALSRNPWQVFRPVQRRVYFDMGAGGGGGTTHTVTADPVKLGSTTTRPGLTQTHVTTAKAVAQGATVSRPAVTQTHVVEARPNLQASIVARPSVTQTHVVTARTVAQGSTVNAPTVEVGSITVVTARPVVQSGAVNAPSIVQTHIVTARPAAQGGTVTRPGLTQTHTVTARAVTQGSVVNAPSVDVGSTPATVVMARPVAQGSTVNAPGIRQTHVTSARAVVQGSTISAPGLVQTHVVTARPVVQAGSVNKPWVATGSSTFTGLSPADLAAIRAAVRSELSAELLRISEIAKLHGLVQGAPLVVTPTSRTAGDVAQTVNTAGATTTVTRQ